jgi:Ca-activated chloride channel homolog
MRSGLASLLFCVGVILAVANWARADGLIVISDPPTPIPGHFSFAPLEVTYHHVSVTIKGRVATTTVDQEFYNRNGRQLEGTYLFPIPAGASIDKFSMDVNGKQTDAELLDADKARSIYEEIVRKHRDPALLEYVGRGVFKARIFPIEANGRKQVKLQYTELLTSDSGLTEYTYSLNTEKFSAAPLKDVSIAIDLTSDQPLKSIYSPSHSVEIRQQGERHAVIGYEDRNVRPDTDFKLVFTQAPDPVGLNLLSYQSGVDDGYFMLLASPGFEVAKDQIQSKDVCFVLDTSGSMAGPKLDQAKKALLFCLANLNADDRFEIIRFSTEAEPLFGKVVDASQDNIKKAQDFIAGLKPIGGTAIDDALKQAIKVGWDRGKENPHRPYVMIFLTDGQPTVGQTNEDAIASTAAKAGYDVRIFCFGIGTDINTQLLDRISNDTNAFTQYVLPDEDIEVKVSNFYTKIKSPVLANVKFDFAGDSRITQVYPSAMPDLYKGQTLVAFGRYSPCDTPEKITLSGMLNDSKQTFTLETKLARGDMSNSFIPKLWAVRRIGWLLDEIRLHGESQELKDEVVQLARAHGIVTPYTAYLILEDEDHRRVPMSFRNMRELQDDAVSLDRARDFYESAKAGAAQEAEGERAVANSQAAQAMKQADNLSLRPDQSAAFSMSKPSAPPATQPMGYRVSTDYTQQAQNRAGKTFFQNGSTWTDSIAQANQNLPQREIKFNSDEYFQLIDKYPLAANWLSLGQEVDIVIDNVLYSIR